MQVSWCLVVDPLYQPLCRPGVNYLLYLNKNCFYKWAFLRHLMEQIKSFIRPSAECKIRFDVFYFLLRQDFFID